MKQSLDAVLTAGVVRGSVPGVAAVVVDRDGVRYEGAFGERQIGSGVDMTFDTVGAIFSMTKAVTAAAAMQLVEQELVGLDAPAADVCQELQDLVVLEGFDQDGQPVTRAASAPVSLRQLLTHTSGFVYDIWNASLTRWHEATGSPTPLSGKRSALLAPLAFEPGTRWHYGTGIDWAGLMVEEVTGLTLGQYFADHLTGPLGMHDTAFDHSPSMLDRAASLHARLPDGSLSPMELQGPDDGDFQQGGGGLKSTMNDYGRFVRMILNDGQLDGSRVLSADTVAHMATNHMGATRVDPLNSCMPALSNDAEFFPGDPKSWGLSFQISETAGHTGRAAGTLMWAGLANSFFWIDRASGLGGAFLSQLLPFADPDALGLFYEFEAAVYAASR